MGDAESVWVVTGGNASVVHTQPDCFRLTQPHISGEIVERPRSRYPDRKVCDYCSDNCNWENCGRVGGADA